MMSRQEKIMNRHERRRQAKMQDVLPEPTNVGRQKKCILMLGSDEQGFQVMPKELQPEEFVELVHADSDRLRALLHRPVILAVHWDERDNDALVQIMPAGKPGTNPDPNKPFVFTLAFPETDGVAA
jgi:hypothetical protein